MDVSPSLELAVVTGGASGIGRVVCEVLARDGIRVVVADTDLAKADEVAHTIGSAGGRSLPLALDVTDPRQVRDVIGMLDKTFGRIDILVNAAGTGQFSPSLDLSLEDWQRVLNVNLTGTFLCCQAAARVMAAGQGGRIVNVSSLAGLTGSPGMAHYTASKHGVVGLTRALAVEWAGYGIRVNCVCPGPTETPMLAGVVDAAQRNQSANNIPLGRLAQPSEQAGAIAFLCSTSADYITGAILCVDGGISAMSPTAPRFTPHKVNAE